VKALIRILLRLLSRNAVYAALLASCHGRLQDPLDGLVQLSVHIAADYRAANIVAEIERSHEHDVNKGRYLLHRFQRFSGLNLHHGQEAIIRLLQIIRQGQSGLKGMQCEWRAESTPPLWRELGRCNQLLHFLDGPDERD
jgi:hypothetical protein